MGDGYLWFIMLMSLLGCMFEIFLTKIKGIYISGHLLRIYAEAIDKAIRIYCIIKLSCKLGILQFQIMQIILSVVRAYQRLNPDLMKYL